MTHLTIEFHSNVAAIPLFAKDKSEAEQYVRWLLTAMREGKDKCRLKTMISMDDETYVNDNPGESERIIREYGGMAVV